MSENVNKPFLAADVPQDLKDAVAEGAFDKSPPHHKQLGQQLASNLADNLGSIKQSFDIKCPSCGHVLKKNTQTMQWFCFSCSSSFTKVQLVAAAYGKAPTVPSPTPAPTWLITDSIVNGVAMGIAHSLGIQTSQVSTDLVRHFLKIAHAQGKGYSAAYEYVKNCIYKELYGHNDGFEELKALDKMGVLSKQFKPNFPNIQQVPKTEHETTFKIDPNPVFYDFEAHPTIPNWAKECMEATPPQHPNCKSVLTPIEPEQERVAGGGLFAEPSIDTMREYNPTRSAKLEVYGYDPEAGGLDPAQEGQDKGLIVKMEVSAGGIIEKMKAMQQKISEEVGASMKMQAMQLTGKEYYAQFAQGPDMWQEEAPQPEGGSHYSSKGSKVAHPSYQKFNKGPKGKKVY